MLFNNPQEITPKILKEHNYFKVDQNGGSFITATFYNPETGDNKIICVRDYDFSDCSRDNDELYYMPIDQAARILYLHSKGIILPGDNVKIIKGRKYKPGTTGKVKDVKPYYDKYKRFICNYLYFETGEKVSADNCILL